MPEDGLARGEDGQQRCWWQRGLPDYQRYHDTEWGRPVADDTRLFEKMCLEGFQSGLSWLTILRKRDNFRRAFAEFDFRQVAQFDQTDIDRLLADTGIVRHRGKIEAAINNAQRALDLVAECGSVASFVWRYEPAPENRPTRFDKEALSSLAQTPESIALSKDLKKRGWRFVGPTTMYAFMQSVGIVNDHLDGCWVRAACTEDRARFDKPA